MAILLVDDNEINLELQKLMLEGCGLSVRTAACGREAVQLTAEHRFELILMDVQMPDLDGFETAALIRKQNNTTPIYALSADAVSPEDERFRKSGMTGALRKPLQVHEVQALLQGQTKAAKPADAETIFDFDQMLDILADEKTIYQILQQFISVHQGDCELLTRHIEEGDFLGARRILHNIRGISGNMLCRRLYSVACALNHELKQERSDSLAQFAEIWDLTLAALTERCSSLSVPETQQTAEWQTLWADFMLLCEEYDTMATEVFTRHMPVFAANLEPDRFALLQRDVLRYDYMAVTEHFGSERND